MVGHLLLTILIYSFHGINTQVLPPKLTLTKSVITETDSVTLNCETPPSIFVSQCDFYVVNQNVSKGSSCVQTLTGTELLKMAHKSVPAETEVRCSYTAKLDIFHFASLVSEPSTITLNNLLPPKLKVSPPMITETDSVILDCETPPSIPVSHCYFRTSRQKPAKRFSCLQKVTGTELLSMAHQSVPIKLEMTCFYLVMYPSPESNMFPVTIQSLLSPTLTVSRSVISETDSVTLNCEAPSSVSECYFYTLSKKTVRKFPCLTQLRASELLEMASLRPPAEIRVNCFYVTQPGGSVSPYSSTTSITIQSTNGNKETTTVMTTIITSKIPSVRGTNRKEDRTTALTAHIPNNMPSADRYRQNYTYTLTPSDVTSGNTSPMNPAPGNEMTDVTSGYTSPMNPASSNKITEQHMLKSVIAVSGCGVAVALFLMGFALVYTQIRTGTSFSKRSKINVRVGCGNIESHISEKESDYDETYCNITYEFSKIASNE